MDEIRKNRLLLRFISVFRANFSSNSASIGFQALLFFFNRVYFSIELFISILWIFIWLKFYFNFINFFEIKNWFSDISRCVDFSVASAIHIESLKNKYIILKIHRRHFNISINVHHKTNSIRWYLRPIKKPLIFRAQ